MTQIDNATILVLYRSLRAAYHAIEKVARARGIVRCPRCREHHPQGPCPRRDLDNVQRPA